MKKFETVNSHKPYCRYDKLKIYVFSTNEVFECFGELFDSEFFKNKVYDNLNSNYNASEVIGLSENEKDDIILTTADRTIQDLVNYQEMLIIKEL